MDSILKGIYQALGLLLTLDQEIRQTTWVSLKVAFLATALATLVGVPIGFLMATRRFPGKRLVTTLLNTLLALPTVVVGLVGYTLLSRRGPLGFLGLLYTQKAIVLGEVILALPIVMAFTLAAVHSVDRRVTETALTLGASRLQAVWTLLREAKFGIMAAVVASFGRVISEVGAAIMLGGNIRGYTRTMTTAIATETSRGAFDLGIALGLVLLVVAFLVNAVFHWFQAHHD